MRTAGTTRRFLADPVSDEALHRALDNARFAPNGGNRQGWHVIVVEDPGVRRELHDLYQPHWKAYLAERYGIREGEPEPPDLPLNVRRSMEFADHLAEVPVHLLVSVDLGALAVTDRNLPRQSIVGGGSVYPFVQNLLLAFREEGLGAALTTLIIPAEAKVKELLAIPPQHALAALVAVGHPAGPLPTKLRRKEVEEFTTRDRFDGERFVLSPRTGD